VTRGKIKCVVWDLDNTVWDGVLLEGDDVVLRPGVRDQLERLDRVGILHSVSSRNDADAALARLRAFGIDEFFLQPQINWNAKSESIRRIAKALNIGLDAFAFIDDQEFERAEVAAALPEVTCVDPAGLAEALRRPEFRPRFVTDESRMRRELYRGQAIRDTAEREFVGTSEEFLAQLDMTLTVRPAAARDLRRAEELTIRTNQLNATGRTYSHEELDLLRQSPEHLLLVASLQDRFGSYGTIGLALVRLETPNWHLRLLLTSCRVMSRGAGTALLGHVMRLARAAGRGLLADLVETGRNRMMRIAYGFAGFREVSRTGTEVLLEADLDRIPPPARYLRVLAE
jgi:FkbH-like protein